MARLSKADLEQMGETYFKSLEPERLVEVAKNLYELAVEQLEKLEQTSQNSSRPPSTDSPYQSVAVKERETAAENVVPEPNRESAAENSVATAEKPNDEGKGLGKRQAGRQPGAQGHWRNQPLKAEQTIPHYPENCAACNASLSAGDWDERPYMGYYQLELEKHDNGFQVVCQMHHYYGATCSCGHHSQMAPGKGEQSLIEGRTIQLQLHSSGASRTNAGCVDC